MPKLMNGLPRRRIVGVGLLRIDGGYILAYSVSPVNRLPLPDRPAVRSGQKKDEVIGYVWGEGFFSAHLLLSPPML
jgi:hypothetical protein